MPTVAAPPWYFPGCSSTCWAWRRARFGARWATWFCWSNSTSLHLAGIGTQWARFSAEVCGAKAHVVYDPDLGHPVYHAVSAANVNDITPAKQMPIEPGATYVFDLGYYDYGWWAELDQADCRIVTRFRTNTPLLNARDTPRDPGSEVLSDRIGFLPARQAKSRKNPMQVAVREVVVMTETGKRLRILTNDLDAPAQEIADLYKRRWLIELFFRMMKQMLRITRFLGRSENAVRIQIAVALIAFLILHLLHKITQAKHGFLEFVRTRARQYHASQGRHAPTRKSPVSTNRLSPIDPRLEIYMNRTAVGLSRPSTSFLLLLYKDVDARHKAGHDGVHVLFHG